MKNITLSADEKLIQAARDRARAEQTTLNNEFRRWLESYAVRDDRVRAYDALMSELRGRAGTGGRRFSREEMNER